jgi:hypothetical protein
MGHHHTLDRPTPYAGRAHTIRRPGSHHTRNGPTTYAERGDLLGLVKSGMPETPPLPLLLNLDVREEDGQQAGSCVSSAADPRFLPALS